MDRQKSLIRDFLIDKGAAFDIKAINEPSKKNFEAMFSFIYVYLDSEFRLTNIIDEVPKIFAALGYPLKIKPSTMQTVSASHSWPFVIDALGWLVEFVTRYEDIELTDMLMHGNKEETIKRAYAYHYFTTCYKKHLSKKVNIDDPTAFTEEKAHFRDGLLANEDGGLDREQILEEKAALETELKQLKDSCQEPECHEIEKECARVQADINALADYLEKAEGFLIGLEKKREELTESINCKMNSLKEIEEENAQKRIAIQNQAMSAQEARQKTTHLNSLRGRLHEFRIELGKWQEEPLNLQRQIFKNFGLLQEKMSQVGDDIAKIAGSYFSKQDFITLGFASLGEDRPMDLTAATVRLEKFEELLKLLLEKMDCYTFELRQQTAICKENSIKCERTVEELSMKRKHLDQEIAEKRKGIEREIEEIKRQEHKLKVEEEIETSKRDVENDKKQRIDEEVKELLERTAKLQMTFGEKYSKYKNEIMKEVDIATAELENYMQEQVNFVNIQSERDENSTKIVTEYIQLLKQVEDMAYEDATTD